MRSAVQALRREIERRERERRVAGPARFAAFRTARLGPVRPGEAPEDAASDPLVGLLAQLRALTAQYVYRMRAEGARPEQTLVRVKACVRDAMAAERWHDAEALWALTDQVVTWSIDAYYDR